MLDATDGKASSAHFLRDLQSTYLCESGMTSCAHVCNFSALKDAPISSKSVKQRSFIVLLIIFATLYYKTQQTVTRMTNNVRERNLLVLRFRPCIHLTTVGGHDGCIYTVGIPDRVRNTHLRRRGEKHNSSKRLTRRGNASSRCNISPGGISSFGTPNWTQSSDPSLATSRTNWS